MNSALIPFSFVHRT